MSAIFRERGCCDFLPAGTGAGGGAGGGDDTDDDGFAPSPLAPDVPGTKCFVRISLSTSCSMVISASSSSAALLASSRRFRRLRAFFDSLSGEKY